jgi:hypothetical protein
MLVRNHLLCPYSDCAAHHRSGNLRIQVLVNQINGQRKVVLRESEKGDREKTSLPYKHNKEVYPGLCPYCQKSVEVVIDETHVTRYLHLRQAK